MAATLQVTVVDGERAMLPDAVVSLEPEAGAARLPVQPLADAVMDQRDAAFVPGVLPVTVGTAVKFPNSDNTLHQIYSFSPTKRFERPLYSGTTAAPVVFDQAGIVTVGCNIHDWMIGYVVVLDTPYFGKSDATGRVALEAPPGKYTLRLWHPRALAPALQSVTVGAAPTALQVAVPLAPPPPPRRGSERLRALQEKFRRAGQ